MSMSESGRKREKGQENDVEKARERASRLCSTEANAREKLFLSREPANEMPDFS